MEKINIKDNIRAFIIDQYVKGDTLRTPKDDDSFLDSRLIDSTGMLELVMFIEETFNIKVEDEELIPDNLDSINRLNEFIIGKRKNKGHLQN